MLLWSPFSIVRVFGASSIIVVPTSSGRRWLSEHRREREAERDHRAGAGRGASTVNCSSRATGGVCPSRDFASTFST